MKVDLPTPIETFHKADEYMRVFRTAVRKAQAESRHKGVANVYVLNGVRVLELPNGDYRQKAGSDQ